MFVILGYSSAESVQIAKYPNLRNSDDYFVTWLVEIDVLILF